MKFLLQFSLWMYNLRRCRFYLVVLILFCRLFSLSSSDSESSSSESEIVVMLRELEESEWFSDMFISWLSVRDHSYLALERKGLSLEGNNPFSSSSSWRSRLLAILQSMLTCSSARVGSCCCRVLINSYSAISFIFWGSLKMASKLSLTFGVWRPSDNSLYCGWAPFYGKSSVWMEV